MALTVPKKIGKYEVRNVLGEGGMGTVYKARDPAIGRTVAIKVVARSEDPGFVTRFHREARANGNLQHPNIVVVHELGDQDGKPFLVMEYLEGESLSSIIGNRRPLSMVDKLDIIIEVCRGLQYAHSQGVVHRDIKPPNLMLLHTGMVKILDFGIARIQNEANVTMTGQVVGTVPYMSPEQLNGGQVDGRTDVFSTAIVLYQLLTYTLPFSAENTGATMQKIICAPAPPLSAHLQSYPAELDHIMPRALAKLPGERYTAEELAAELIQVRERLRVEITVQGLPIIHGAGALMNRQQETTSVGIPDVGEAYGLALSPSPGAAKPDLIPRPHHSAWHQRDLEFAIPEGQQRERKQPSRRWPSLRISARRQYQLSV